MPGRFFSIAASAALGMALQSCAAGQSAKNKTKKLSACEAPDQASSHAAMAVRAKATEFAGCFSNYMKLRELDKVEVSLCARLTADIGGRPSRVRVFGEDDALSNDLKWCLEQQLWKMDFSKLQYSSAQKLTFPLRFEVRKSARNKR